MNKLKSLGNSNQRIKFVLIFILSLVLLTFLGRNYIIEMTQSPATRSSLITIAKEVVPIKNFFLMRNINDKIELLKSTGACVFCDLSQGNFEGSDLKNVDLRYANLTGANLSNVNLEGALIHHANLTDANLDGVDLSDKNLTNVILDGVNLSKINLTGSILNGVDLRNVDLTGAILSRVDLRENDLTGTNLAYANLTGAKLDETALMNKDLTGAILSGLDLTNIDLTGTILTHADLTGVNLTEADLSNKDLTGTILTFANLTGTNLDGVDLRNKNLTGVNLSGVDLSNLDLTGAILIDVKNIEITIENTIDFNWPELNEIQNLNITRYDYSADANYIATKEGLLFESLNNKLRLVLDLNKNANFPFDNVSSEGGLLGIASKNKLVYVSYSSKDANGSSSLVVDEYSLNFSKVRNIIKIPDFDNHFGGNLLFDNLGSLYLSVGDGYTRDEAQNLNSLKGKILRLDVSQSKLEPEIIAYGIRNPWGVTIDSKDRMFILQCGWNNVEAVYLLDDLYLDFPINFGWPIFEGSVRMSNDSLMLKDLSDPIFETSKRPGCLTGGLYLTDLDLFLFSDFYGTIRLLKQKENGEWYLVYENKHENETIWGFGFDKDKRKIFVAPSNRELNILVNQVKF